MKNSILFVGCWAASLTLTATAGAHNGVAHNPNLPAATKAQIHEVADAVERYRDFSVAQREGWTKFGGDEPLMGEHWSDPRGPDYVSGQPIDFRRPSNLMYTTIGGRKVLTGVAFIVRIGDDEPVPEGFAGKSDRWHIHDFVRAIDAATVDRPLLRWIANGWLDKNYRSKGDNRGRLAMAHVWVTLPNPDGIFADANRTLPYLKLGLPVAYAEGATLAAARGLTLATEGGCKEMIDGRLWIANAKSQVSRSMHAICKSEGNLLRGKLTAPAAELNRSASMAWQRFDTAWNAALTTEQRARIAAITEHGGSHKMPDGTMMSNDAMGGHDH